MHEELETGPPPSEAAMRPLAPEVVSALSGLLASEVESREYQPFLERVGAQIAELLSSVEPLAAPVARLIVDEVQTADVDGLDAAVMARIELAMMRPPPLSAAVVAAIAADVPPAPGALVAAVQAQIDALQSAAMSETVRAALAADVPEPPRSLSVAVMAQLSSLEAPPLPEAIVRALADEASPGADPSLYQAVMAQVERAVEEELARETPVLALVGRELETEAERMHAARVVSEVQAEVRTIGPRLERELPGAVQKRITRGYAPTGARPPARTPRWSGAFVRGAAAVLAAAAAVVLYLRPPTIERTPSGLPPLTLSQGEVHVEEIVYDGTVTVIEADGVAVIWLADEGAS